MATITIQEIAWNDVENPTITIQEIAWNDVENPTEDQSVWKSCVA